MQTNPRAGGSASHQALFHTSREGTDAGWAFLLRIKPTAGQMCSVPMPRPPWIPTNPILWRSLGMFPGSTAQTAPPATGLQPWPCGSPGCLRKQLQPQLATSGPIRASPRARLPLTPLQQDHITSFPTFTCSGSIQAASLSCWIWEMLQAGLALCCSQSCFPFPSHWGFPAKPPLPHPNAPLLLPASDNPDEFSEIVLMKLKTSLEGFVSEVIC